MSGCRDGWKNQRKERMRPKDQEAAGAGSPRSLPLWKHRPCQRCVRAALVTEQDLRRGVPTATSAAESSSSTKEPLSSTAAGAAKGATKPQRKTFPFSSQLPGPASIFHWQNVTRAAARESGNGTGCLLTPLRY